MNLPFHNPSKDNMPSQSSPLENSNTKRTNSLQKNSLSPNQNQNLSSDIENFPDFLQSLNPSPHSNSSQTHQDRHQNTGSQNPQQSSTPTLKASSRDSEKEWNERPKIFVHRFGDPASSIKFISINARDKSKDVIDSEINESKTGINLLIDNSRDDDSYKWTSKKDDALLQLALELKGDWSKVAQRFPDPNIQIKTLKTRYKTLMNVKLPNKARFSKKEDAKICRYHEVYGTNWESISKLMPGRTPTAIKNRFYSSLRDMIHAKNTSDENPPENESSHHHHQDHQDHQDFPSLTINSMIPQKGESDINASLRRSDENLMIHSARFKENRTQGDLDCDHFFSFSYSSQENRMNNRVAPENNHFRNATTLPVFHELPYLNLSNHPLHQFQPKLGKIETNQAESSQLNHDPKIPTDKSEDDFQEPELDPALAIQELNDRAAMLESLCHQIQDTFNEVKRGKGN